MYIHKALHTSHTEMCPGAVGATGLTGKVYTSKVCIPFLTYVLICLGKAVQTGAYYYCGQSYMSLLYLYRNDSGV